MAGRKGRMGFYCMARCKCGCGREFAVQHGVKLKEFATARCARNHSVAGKIESRLYRTPMADPENELQMVDEVVDRGRVVFLAHIDELRLIHPDGDEYTQRRAMEAAKA